MSPSSAPLGKEGGDWAFLVPTPAEGNTGGLREHNREGMESACRDYNRFYFLSLPISYMECFSAAHLQPKPFMNK